ncbi:methyltransferase, FxLD system [Actinomadura sp. 3N508]|uniref:methyltransferase, FxLD system n=1 Tax=Actinomadura sp. 3N508 TaxID=3375153 RepID=UPI0037ACB08A
MNIDDEVLPKAAETGWWHATMTFPGGTGISPQAAQQLSRGLKDQRFHFLRKGGELRLRTQRPVADLLDSLVADQRASGWTGSVYEPETEAFGGPEGMDIAHEVFCADSPAALAETGSPHARERCVLLLSAMIRAAGLDPFETGDVWAKIGALRPPVTPPTGPGRDRAIAAIRRLTTADAAQRPNAEPGWAERVAAFENAGHQLRQQDATGRLTRGLRAILAHHAIFAFNRAAVPAHQQAATAWLGHHIAFAEAEHPAVSAQQDTSTAPSLTRMEKTLTPADPADLREALVNRLIHSGHLRTPEVIAAFGDTERHRFLPGINAPTAYAEDAIPIKHDEAGEMISCISAPSIVATQLEQLDTRPGHKVLEAGAATGYNAALLGRLVAPGGHVWTVDVDHDLIDRARSNLTQAGASNVTVVLADGAAGLPEHAPFDRIQFTVGAGDVPVKILDQLTPTGRLILPMRIRGSISRSFAFERTRDNTWATVSCEMATFVPLRKGVCDDIYTPVPMAGEGNVRLETFSEQNIDREALRTALDHEQTKVYSGVKFRQGDPWQWLYLYLASVLPNGLSRMPGSRPGFTPHFGWGSMAALDGDTLAYLTVREGADDHGRFWEIGAIGHGSRATDLADQVTTEIREWDQGWGNSAPAPTFHMAVGNARDQLTATEPRFIIDKPHSRLVLDWPRRS